MRIGIVVLSCSLIAGFAAGALGLDYEQLDARLAKADVPEAVSIARSLADDEQADGAVGSAAERVLDETGTARIRAIADLRWAVKTRAEAQSATHLGDKDAIRKAAVAAKTSPLYTDPAARKGSNWIGKGFEGLEKIRLRPPGAAGRLPNVGFLPYGIIYLVWVLLGAALLYLGYLAVRHFSWKRSLRRKAKALLEEDEPERTLDEWLEMADRLTAEGKHREAVRCLYLACLLRFDEHLVARFDRGQTNWEHLARIQASSRLPVGLDFEPPTKRFDTIWYGQRTRGMMDVDQFRQWYERIAKTLAEAKA